MAENKKCAICGSSVEIVKKDGKAFLSCTNEDCESGIEEISLDRMEIQDIVALEGCEHIGDLVTHVPRDASRSHNGGDYYAGWVVYKVDSTYIVAYNNMLYSDFENRGWGTIGFHESLREAVGWADAQGVIIHGARILQYKWATCGNEFSSFVAKVQAFGLNLAQVMEEHRFTKEALEGSVARMYPEIVKDPRFPTMLDAAYGLIQDARNKKPKRVDQSRAVEQLKDAIMTHFEWCKGTPPNEETASEETHLLEMVDKLDKSSRVRVIYSTDPIELELWDGRRIEIGSKLVQIRANGEVQAVYGRQKPREQGSSHQAQFACLFGLALLITGSINLLYLPSVAAWALLYSGIVLVGITAAVHAFRDGGVGEEDEIDMKAETGSNILKKIRARELAMGINIGKQHREVDTARLRAWLSENFNISGSGTDIDPWVISKMATSAASNDRARAVLRKAGMDPTRTAPGDVTGGGKVALWPESSQPGPRMLNANTSLTFELAIDISKRSPTEIAVACEHVENELGSIPMTILPPKDGEHRFEITVEKDGTGIPLDDIKERLEKALQ